MCVESGLAVPGKRFVVQRLVTAEGASDPVEFSHEPVSVLISPASGGPTGDVVSDGFEPCLVVKDVITGQEDE